MVFESKNIKIFFKRKYSKLIVMSFKFIIVMRIQTSAANLLDMWVNASGQTTVHKGSYPRIVVNKKRWIQNESKPQNDESQLKLVLKMTI